MAGDVCIQGLNLLQFRGYDSCGVASLDESNNFVVSKFASTHAHGGDCITQIEKEGAGKHDHHIGIGHTRWATHGAKTQVNAHPHLDSSGKIAIVHNGMLSNHKEIRDELRDLGVTPVSETDTELIV